MCLNAEIINVSIGEVRLGLVGLDSQGDQLDGLIISVDHYGVSHRLVARWVTACGRPSRPYWYHPMLGYRLRC